MKAAAPALALIGLLLMAAPALADNWVKVGKDLHGFDTYLDVESFLRTGRNTFQLQVKSVHPEGSDSQQYGEQLDYSLEDFRINCETRMIRTKKIVIFGKSGKQLAEMAPVAEQPIESDSLPDFLAREMCPKLSNAEQP